MCRLRVQLAHAINENHCCACIFVDIAIAFASRQIWSHGQKCYVIRQDG
jgi:hypothetical protein